MRSTGLCKSKELSHCCWPCQLSVRHTLSSQIGSQSGKEAHSFSTVCFLFIFVVCFFVLFYFQTFSPLLNKENKFIKQLKLGNINCKNLSGVRDTYKRPNYNMGYISWKTQPPTVLLCNHICSEIFARYYEQILQMSWGFGEIREKPSGQWHCMCSLFVLISGRLPRLFAPPNWM